MRTSIPGVESRRTSTVAAGLGVALRVALLFKTISCARSLFRPSQRIRRNASVYYPISLSSYESGFVNSLWY